MSVIVREAADADREAIVGMIQGLNRFESEVIAGMDTTWGAAEAHMRSLESEIGENRGFALVAEADGAAIGFLVGFVETETDVYVLPDWRTYGLVSDLYVAEAARGTGVGRALVAEAERRFDALGLSRMRIGVLAGNGNARAAYESLGFSEVELKLEKPVRPRGG